MYVKCMTPQVAAAAFNSLNGRFFAGECSLPFIAMFILCHVHVADDHHCVWGVGSLPFTLLASKLFRSIARNSFSTRLSLNYGTVPICIWFILLLFVSAGKKIVAQFIAETTYHIKFPAALAAVVPLKTAS